jgi:hypothetical protein
VLNKGEIATLIFTAIGGIGAGGLPVPTKIELESALPDIIAGASSTLYYLIENMDVISPDTVRQGMAWVASGGTTWTKFVDLVNQLSLDAFKQRDDGSWVLADDIQTLIDGAVQGSQIHATEPTAASTDLQITSAKRLWSMLGGALSTLTTTAKTITGAINELVSGKQAAIPGTAGYVKATDTAGTAAVQAVPIPVADGGTGATDLPGAQTNGFMTLGPNTAYTVHSQADIDAIPRDCTGTLSITIAPDYSGSIALIGFRSGSRSLSTTSSMNVLFQNTTAGPLSVRGCSGYNISLMGNSAADTIATNMDLSNNGFISLYNFNWSVSATLTSVRP